MSFSVGITGLPNVGKSTLFKILTKKKVDIAPHPFTTINPNLGIVQVPDHRLDSIAKIVEPQKITPTIIEFVDIAGLIKGAHKGEGLGNQFLAHIRNCDAILEVIRVFDDSDIENVLGEISPEKEIQVINTELLMKDLETLETSISKLEKKKDKAILKKLNILKKIREGVSQGKLVSEIELKNEEKLEIKEYQFLTEKPILYILNTDSKTDFKEPERKHLVMNIKEKEDILELSKEERKELKLKLNLKELITGCYDILNLITFFTITGGKEVRAWTATKGSRAKEAGGIVHSDFEKKFIKAEVINWQNLIDSGSLVKAREKGLIRIVGKDYVLQDGDVIEFKI
ncbi:MAG: YchF family ATPase [Patescibacteria group bacterium]|nr:YchF family ATPase [Patescibacteria group bacterium]